MQPELEKPKGIPVRQEVQSVRRAMSILFAFSLQRPQLSVAEIADIAALNRTTTHRLVATLESCGILRRAPFSQKYTLSAQLLKFSDIILQQNDLRAAALPVMTALRDAVNETIALHIREGWSRIVLMQVGANRDVRHMYRNIGEPIPLHIGAPGKTLLAHIPVDERDAYLSDAPLVEATPNSVTDPALLREDLKSIATSGYAVSWGERRPDVVAIAAPIFDAAGNAIAAMNVSGPSQRIQESEVQAIIPRLVQAARDVSHAIGHLDSMGNQSAEALPDKRSNRAR